MLDAFIIDELRRREEADKDDSDRPRLEIPVERDEREPPGGGNGDGNRKDDDDDDDDDEKSDRGVIIIDL